MSGQTRIIIHTADGIMKIAIITNTIKDTGLSAARRTAELIGNRADIFMSDSCMIPDMNDINYVAYDMLTNTRRFSDHYGLSDKKQFEAYLQGQLDKIVLPNKDEAFLRTKILEMYTNPLKNHLAIDN